MQNSINLITRRESYISFFSSNYPIKETPDEHINTMDTTLSPMDILFTK